MAEEPTLRECPECSELVKPRESEAAMCCSQGHHFCSEATKRSTFRDDTKKSLHK